MNQPDPNNPRHKGLFRLIVGRNSIQEARRAARYVADNITTQYHELFGALECAVAVCYARPFIARRGRGRISANYEQFPEEWQAQLHRILLEHRNTFMAHSDEEKNVVTFRKPGAKVTLNNGTLTAVSVTFGEQVTSKTLRLELFPHIVELCDYQVARISLDIHEEKHLLLSDDGKETRSKPHDKA